MNFKTLLLESQLFYKKQPNQVKKIAFLSIFTEGGKWMSQKMSEIDPNAVVSIDKSTPFAFYGFLKYSLCLGAFLGSFCYFLNKNSILTPISILFFYFVEIHFLFLFPLLIDKTPYPLLKSIKITYKIGVLKSLFRVMRIAVFMLFGLLNFKNPLKNWHIGCLFILIWYQHEVRNRL